MDRLRTLLLTAVLAMTAVIVVGTTPAAAAPGVDPAAVELTLAPGASTTLSANVTTPDVSPQPDIVLLGDTTGSMDPVLANVRDNVGTIVDTVRAAQPDARFAVAEYKEKADGPRVFQVNTPLTADADAVRDGTRQWLYNVGGGGQPWTDFVNAFYRIGTDQVAFRTGGTRIVAWFGDARSNDPSLDHTLAATNKVLTDAGVRVVAIPVLGTTGGGLDALGQATSITSATRGVLMPEQAADQVAQAILDGVRALDVTVTPRPACDAPLTVGFDPEARRVRGGTAAAFTESVSVAPGTAAGTYRCTVDFRVNGIAEGITQSVTVHVSGDGPAAGLSVGDVTVTEGDTGTTPATFPVSLAAPSATEVTVRWATTPGTASAGDFTGGSGVLTFPPGTVRREVTVPVVGDEAAEPDESFTVGLSAPNGAVIADGSGVGTIVDDDSATTDPALSIGDVTVPEDGGPARLSVRLSDPAASPVTVRWATADGSATAPGDYTAGTDTLTVAASDDTGTVEIPLVDDAVAEPAETFTVRLSDPVGARLADAEADVTVTDDDDRAGRFGCTSSALNLLGSRPAVANPAVLPCADDEQAAVRVRLGLGLLRVEADGLTARTDLAPGGVSATGGLLTTRISTLGLTIGVEAITATATATCVGDEVAFSGSSTIVALTVNGTRIPIGSAPVTVPLLIGSLELNSTEVTDDGVVQRAFALRTLLGDVVVGEARATAEDGPC